MSGWRYIAQRLDGINNDLFIDFDLPLSGVQIEESLTGYNNLTAAINPELGRLKSDDGTPLLQPWGTAIWADYNGSIYGGGILNHSGFVGSDWQLECIGLTGYLKDLPYDSSTFFVEEDPLNIFRHIWAYAQSKPGGNLFIDVDPLLTGLQIGTTLEQVEFDTVSGPVSFESGPYKLAWYQTHDLSDNVDNLAADTPFDWRERHYWVGDEIQHRIELGYPRLGRRRTDLRFVIGENIFEAPSIEDDGEEYASETLILGAGEGPAMIRGSAKRDTGRLRRVAVVSEPGIRSITAATSAAQRELATRINNEKITDLVVRDHPHASSGAVEVGDEILIQGQTGWKDVEFWAKVLTRTFQPEEGDQMTLGVVRSDRLA